MTLCQKYHALKRAPFSENCFDTSLGSQILNFTVFSIYLMNVNFCCFFFIRPGPDPDLRVRVGSPSTPTNLALFY